MKKVCLLFCLLLVCRAAMAIENPEARVSDAVKKYILAREPNWAREELRLSFKFADKNFDQVRGFPESAKITVMDSYSDLRVAGTVIFPLQVKNGDEVFKFYLRTKVEVLKDIVAAARLIKKGSILAADDFVIEKRDVAMLPQKYFVEESRLIGKEAKLTIPSGSTIFEYMAGDLPLIKRGAEVTIIVTGPDLQIKTRGQAVENGYRDQLIKVKRKDMKKTLQAKVISSREVEVEIE